MLIEVAFACSSYILIPETQRRRCETTSRDYGMGVVSPNGVGSSAFSEGVLSGRSGVRRISRFDSSEIPVQIAGEVPDFDELAWVEKRDRKHVSRVLPLALAAATEALGNAGFESRFPAARRETALWRDHRFGRRIAGIYRGTISSLLSSAVQADEFVLRAHWSDGRAFERIECALRVPWREPRNHDGLHFVHRRVRIFAAADSIGTAGHGIERGSGCAHCIGDC